MTLNDTFPIMLGGALTLVGAVATQWFSRHFESRKARRAVAAAFAGEIGAICAIVRRLEFLENARLFQQAIRQGEVLRISISTTQDYLTIFKANASAIGALPPLLALDTVRFYTQIKSMLEDVRPDAPTPTDIEQADQTVTHLISLMVDTLQLGDGLVVRLREAAK